ncbi:MAG: transcription elongation factor GreA [Salinivirgaceae bacterium]|jgi:transcription elongation factor GreA|nr:transcription elongation factor GreA [Salinivirgaceae bacterium]
MGKLSYVTEDGFKRMMAELETLKTVQRPAITREIADARDKGDLSENAEYDAAKEAQGMLEMKIAQLQNTIQNSRVIDESKLDYSSVQILSKVKIKNIKNNAQMEYAIVSEAEADLKKGRISINTPIALGLLGKKVGDKVEVTVPSGVMEFEILEINPLN